MKLAAAIAIALTLAAAATEPEQRPNLGEWKEGKAAEANAATAETAIQAKMSAVDKVIAMLESLQQQVLGEGEKEAQTYNKYSCFCADTTADKTKAINRGVDEKATISATIEKLTQDRAELDTTIEGLLADIKAAEETMEGLTAARKAELDVYEKNAADLMGAIGALEGAIKSMKASKNPSLMQLQSIAKTLQTAVLMADALGLAKAQKVAMFLQQAPDVPMEDYKFHSAGIIETLEGLLVDFRNEKSDLDKEEVSAVTLYDGKMQEQTDILKQKNVELADAKKAKAQKHDEIATNSQELTTVAATLLDDQEYLKELSQMCSDKARTWDQRTKVRQDELSALTAAIGIITGAVKGKTSAATVRFVQKGVSVRLAEAVARNPEAMEAVEAEAEAADAAVPSFVQVSDHKFLSPKTSDGREAVLAILQGKGQQLKSTLLTALASRIAADPFAKVKQLIQELIDRLLKEASSEANQKGWCDKATADAEQKRDYASGQVEELNAKMAQLEALRDTLAEDLKVLANEIAELETTRADATTLREEEKTENAATVQEAQEGLAAVEEAIDILDKFYKTVAKESVELVQKGPADDAPDAGFKNFESYNGAQGEAGGIIGMLEIIQSDFQRTISETEKAEAQAEQDFLKLMTETGKSLAEKNTAHKEKTSQKDDAEEKLDSADQSLTSQAEIMNTAIKELLELKPACIDTGMSYSERAARREDEIAACKKALCVLEDYEAYGPDAAGGSC